MVDGHFKETEADRAVRDGAFAVTADELRQFIERIEQLRSEQADIKTQEKEVFAEIKSRGYMTRPIRTLIKERAMNPDDLAEEQAILDMYRAAVGMP
jgi:uncharacterized protein (UPF0335 family)